MEFEEEEYLDVLQNIESAIIVVYAAHPELTDFDVDRAIESLARFYVAQIRGREPRPIRLNPLSQEVFDSVKMISEWRLGRQPIHTRDSDEPIEVPEPLSEDELVACLKRIRKSIRYWNKEGGRRGYLNFIGTVFTGRGEKIWRQDYSE